MLIRFPIIEKFRKILWIDINSNGFHYKYTHVCICVCI